MLLQTENVMNKAPQTSCPKSWMKRRLFKRLLECHQGMSYMDLQGDIIPENRYAADIGSQYHYLIEGIQSIPTCEQDRQAYWIGRNHGV